MQKTKSKKIEQWTTKDLVLNILVYVLNILIISMLFVLAVYIEGNSGNIDINIENYIKNITTPIHFLIMLILIFSVMALYFFYEDRNFLKNAANSEMLFLIVEISLIACFISGKYVNVYLRPLALVALLTAFLTDRRKAFFMNIIFCLLIFLFDSFAGTIFVIGNYPILLMGFSSGVIAIMCMDKIHSRLRLLTKSFLVSLPSLVCVAMMLIEKAETEVANVLSDLISGTASGPLACSLLIVALPIFEAIFKKVSCFKFSELIEHNAKLIKKLIQRAPGTFNHSIVVSNIAEACALAIEEDGLLARTCAYYHDIGKLRRPEFFKENQADGDNPHDDLTPELSVNIIKSHAQDGYNLIMKNRLPKVIADVCLEHHGTLPILYFYGKAQKYTDGEVDLAQYCYPGPKPSSKIAAIVMIADGCEAAARTLQDRSRENVKKVVRQIVNERMQLGQFEECEITLNEINIIIHTVVNHLTGVYHNRIEYPKVSLDGMEV